MKKIFLALLVITMCLALIPSCTFYETQEAYTPPVTAVPDYYTMRVYDNRYVFYSAAEPVAIWTFGADGVCIKEGVVINGPVRVYSQPGVLFAETYYSNGIRDGGCRYYYPSGAVMYSGYYRAGYLSGNWSSYDVNGGVTASYQFHGNETTMPSNFPQPQNSNARVGFQAMQKETTYAPSAAVTQAFNRAHAVPTNYTRSFGAPPPAQPANFNANGMHQGNPGAGVVQAQGIAQHPGMVQSQQSGNVQGQQPGMVQGQSLDGSGATARNGSKPI